MKTLDTFDFRGRTTGRGSQYQWHEMLDGGTYQLTAGEDYQCETTTFAALLRRKAFELDKHVKIANVEGGVVIQGSDMEPEEVEANEAKKLARKAKLKEYADRARAKRNGKHAEPEAPPAKKTNPKKR